MSQSPPPAADLRILVTANSEYHFSGDMCVGVRDSAGCWDLDHPAIGETLVGSFFVRRDGRICFTIGVAVVGHRLCLSNDLLTSPLAQKIYPTVVASEDHWELAA